MAAGQHPGMDPVDGLRIELIAAERSLVGREWRFERVVSPFLRLYAVHAAERARVVHDGRTWPLQPARLHLVPAFTPGDYRCDGRLDHTWLHIAAVGPSGLDLSQVLDLPRELPATPEHRQRIGRIVAGRRGGAAQRLAADGEVRLLLADFVAAAAAARPAASDPFAELVTWIAERLDQPLRVEDLAARVGMRPSWFTTRFRARFGTAPKRWLRERRLERAARLLRQGLRVEAVAGRCGWSDRAHFARAFAARFGMGPAGWRRAQARAP